MADNYDNGDDVDLPVGKEAVNRLISENSTLFSDDNCKVCSAQLISESQKLAHYQSKKHANKYRRYLSIHQGETFVPAKRMKTDDVQDAADESDRNKCCPVCNMTFSSPVVAASHYIGRTHAKNLRLKEYGGVPEALPPIPKKPRVAPAPEKPTGTPDPSDREKFCQLCKATFNNPLMAEQHYAGKKHKKQETKSRLMTIYTSSGSALPQSTPLKPLTPGSASTGNGFSCDICSIVVNSIDQYQAHISGAKHTSNLKAMLPMSAEDRPLSSGITNLNSASVSSASVSSSRLPASRISSSTSGFLSSGYYLPSRNDVTPLATLPMSRERNLEKSVYSPGLRSLSSYSTPSYDSYTPKRTTQDDYDYYNQRY
ncbi:zinc finger protein 346 isoform X2 [Hyperolius riggenbachi]|uniref:zinc finger protein 346 isoform X2 n=1 Tax=Hyperolius riggenbachi TaxID=752182 RepID=UPI0035A2B25E